MPRQIHHDVGAPCAKRACEVHDDPLHAKSDAQNALRLDRVEPLLRRLMAIDAIAKASEVRVDG